MKVLGPPQSGPTNFLKQLLKRIFLESLDKPISIIDRDSTGLFSSFGLGPVGLALRTPARRQLLCWRATCQFVCVFLAETLIATIVALMEA